MSTADYSLDSTGNALAGFIAILKLHHGPVFHRALLPNSNGFQFLGIRPDGTTVPGETYFDTADPLIFPTTASGSRRIRNLGSGIFAPGSIFQVAPGEVGKVRQAELTPLYK